ncbi:ATP-dependent 6-phosphofructokinase 7 [Capsicum baccatum]|uniref:ATP-dependent 6-phosphofructokinase 7 n=1 Tax=Capsicum baccatum TaxID=33114 RepID=A0A2G2VFI0_CAPBA|nr:ATP-dependent 6-phosphofructokinase 7 [Capsicum baccatum]
MHGFGADFTTKHNTYSYEGRVVDSMAEINLSNNQLSGEIPRELCNLTAMQALNLSSNDIIGTILSKFSNLQKIESLDLSYNKLSRRIPPQLVDLTTLAVFSVAHNNLTEEKSGIHIIPVFISVDPERDTVEQVINKSFGFDITIEEAQCAINAAHVEAQSAENDIDLVKLMGRYSGNMLLLSFMNRK